MHYKTLIVGLIFLINPSINIVDILPDAIGFALILHAVSSVVNISPSIEESALNAKKLMLLSVFKCMITPIMYSVVGDDKTFILLFTFCFTLAESVYMVYCFSYLFTGTSYLNTRYGTDPQLSVTHLKLISYIFVAVRAFFTVLPEMEYFPAFYQESDMLTEANISILTPYKSILVSANILAVLITGIFWFVAVRTYIKKLSGYKSFNDELKEAAENTYVNPTKSILKNTKFAIYYSAAGFLCMFDIYIDGLNLLPDFIGIALIALGMISIAREFRFPAKELKLACAAFAISLLSFGLNIWFWKKLYVIGTIRFSRIAPQYFALFAVLAAGTAVMIFLYRAFRNLFCEMVNNRVGIDASEEFVRLNKQNHKTRLSLKNRANIAFVIGIIAEISSLLEFASIYSFHEYWMINLVIHLVLLWITYSMICDYRDQVVLKYQI